MISILDTTRKMISRITNYFCQKFSIKMNPQSDYYVLLKLFVVLTGIGIVTIAVCETYKILTTHRIDTIYSCYRKKID
jgi:hypothetical protein